MPADTLNINGRDIGANHPPFIIAELSGNHNGSLQRCLDLVEAAANAGADAVKLQTYRPDTITINHDAPEFFVQGGPWDGRRLYELYDEAHTPWEWHEAVFRKARDLGITVFSAPFDNSAIDLLEELDTPAYKIASPELIDIPLIRRAAATGKPLIMSTGMASLDEIHEAVTAAREAGDGGLLLLHCTAAYPTPAREANLSTITDLARRFDLAVGLSDHTLGTEAACAAIALGACAVEKHVTLRRADGGVDSAFSLEPHELRKLVDDCTQIATMLGGPAYAPTESEASSLRNRRSLYVVAPIARGEAFSAANLRSIRPGLGLHPRYLEQVFGRRANRDIGFGEPLDIAMIDGGLSE
jgi:N-acetylneuraminate synthase